MQYTLLEMVQRILASMDSDEVDSITDTSESYQVALLIEGVYRDLVAECNLPETYTLFELNESGSASQPTLMTIPSEILGLEWVKYNQQEDTDTFPDFQPVRFMELCEFLNYTYAWSTRDDGTIGSFDYTITNGDNSDTMTFLYRNDVAPSYYTSWNDGTLIFDSYDDTIDTAGLQKGKTMCWGSIGSAFTLQDEFVPTLDASQFSLLMNEAKARAFVELKQASNINAEGHARRLRIRLRNTKQKVPHQAPWPQSGLPNYGRK